MAEAPDRSFLDPAILGRLSNLSVHARSPMVGTVAGLHKSPFRGSSVEFSEYRKYAPGDDVRRLDWRVFARSDRFYIKEYEAETNLRCYMVLDCSGSMGFSVKHGSKLAYAKRLVGMLSHLLAQQGDAVGLHCFAEKVVTDIPPSRKVSNLKIIFDTLAETAAKGATRLIPTLHNLAEKIRPRALVIIFSDFFCDMESLLNSFQHLRFCRHDLAVFQILDRAELDFDFNRPTRFHDLESSASVLTEPSAIRARYLKALENHLEQLQTGCRSAKADYRRVVTDGDAERVLADFLLERARTK